MDRDKSHSVSLREWINWQKQNAEKMGWKFDGVKAVEQFTAKDIDSSNHSRAEVDGEVKPARKPAKK